MKLLRYLLIGFICFSTTVNSQILIPKKDYVPEIRQSRYSFALSLISGANSDMVSFGIMRQNPDSSCEMLFLTKDAFIRQVSGNETSRANPNKINFFLEHQIDPKILNELWRLKHDVFPYGKNEQIGWGTKLGVPSEAQFELLKEFGLNKMSDYVYGENLWRLLKKINDPLWTGTYQLRKP
jgi:hypothetical protein